MPPSNRYVRQLPSWWSRINMAVFGGALLTQPKFALCNVPSLESEGVRSPRTIRVSRSFCMSNSWWAVTELLKHDMAHQYVADVIGIEDGPSHAAALRMVCKQHGLCVTPDGHPRTSLSQPRTDTIKRLLALATSTNLHEARAALLKAKQLMRNSLVTEPATEADAPIFSALAIGAAVASSAPHEIRLASVLERCFAVRSTWVDSLDAAGHPGKQLELLGRPADIARAEYARELLLAEANRRWAHRKGSSHRNQRDFLDNVIAGFETGLGDDEGANAVGAGAVFGAPSDSAELAAFFERRHPEQIGGSCVAEH